MSDVLMGDFAVGEVGYKPATWCKACSSAVKNRTAKSCGEHAVAFCQKCKVKLTVAHTCLEFVGHADVRARLCKADPEWTWEPFDFPGTGSVILSEGLPVGLWISLTVGGVSKPGYGSVDKGKPEAMKELIGDALRNAGLSFGIAWKLWAKGDRTGDGEGGQTGSSGDTWDNAKPASGRQNAGDAFDNAAQGPPPQSSTRGTRRDQPAAPATESPKENTTASAGDDQQWIAAFRASIKNLPPGQLAGKRPEIGRAIADRKISPNTGTALSGELIQLKRQKEQEQVGASA